MLNSEMLLVWMNESHATRPLFFYSIEREISTVCQGYPPSPHCLNRSTGKSIKDLTLLQSSFYHNYDL